MEWRLLWVEMYYHIMYSDSSLQTVDDILYPPLYSHHEHIGMAADKLARVTDAALSDEKAQPLFDQATEHFRSSTSNCLVQWGSVMITKVKRGGPHGVLVPRKKTQGVTDPFMVAAK